MLARPGEPLEAANLHTYKPVSHCIPSSVWVRGCPEAWCIGWQGLGNRQRLLTGDSVCQAFDAHLINRAECSKSRGG